MVNPLPKEVVVEPTSLKGALPPLYEVIMVVAYGFNLNHSFGCTQKKNSISTIDSKEPLNLTYKRIFFFLFLLLFGSLLASGNQKKKERLRPKLGIVWCSSLMWRQDRVEDRDRNESSITRPRTGIKTGFV